ncbi:MAG: ATPase, T2SS/T4P/T4SS family [Acidobacteriota bacterium]
MTDAELADRLAELSLRHGLLATATIERARTFQRTRGSTLAGAIATLQLIPGDILRGMLEEVTGSRAVDPSLMTVYPDFVARVNQLLPAALVGRLLVFPAQMEANALHVCMLNPTDGWTVRALEAVSGCRVFPLVTHEAAVITALTQHYGTLLDTKALRYQVEGSEAEAEAAYQALLARPFESYAEPAVSLVNRNRDLLSRGETLLHEVIRDPVIIRLVHQILCRAVEAGASDLHIEPAEHELRIRARIDGSLRDVDQSPAPMALPIVSRLKAMADVPVTAATEPIDAHIGYNLVWGRAIDLRFSLVPAVTGEKIVLRVLERTRARRDLKDLGVDPHTHQRLVEACDLPNGLILVTGPTGSGKSSTLYALLDRLNSEDLSVLTAEDPVESRLDGITQVQCQPGTAMTFATVLRSFLRQDPDVMMVGEVRDAETADIALKAALTGHLVLSTLHTNDAPGAVLRLLNMDLEPFIVASSLRLIVAQRLVRRLCAECKQIDTSAVERLAQLAASDDVSLPEGGTARVYKAVGCPRCSGSGYRGRTGIHEVLRVSPRIEELILARAGAQAVREAARRDGMITLRQAAWRKALAGDTSLAEVFDHTMAHEPEVASA